MDPYLPYPYPEPELTSDLEWMLHSGEAPLPVLADALLEAYYSPVYRLALCVLRQPAAALQAVPELFSAALEDLHRYPAARSTHAWLFGTVLAQLRKRQRYYQLRARFWPGSPAPEMPARSPETVGETHGALERAIDELAWEERGMLFLTQVLSLTPVEAAQALLLDEGQAEKALSWSQAYCNARLVLEIGLEGIDEDTAWLAQSLRMRWPDPEPLGAEARAVLAGKISNRVARGAHGKRRITLVKEISALVVVIGLVSSTLWAYSQLQPDAEVAAPTALPTQAEVEAGPRLLSDEQRLWYIDQFPIGVFYTVLPRDTWERAAVRLGTTEEELRQLNRIAPSQPLQIDQRLLIPGRISPYPFPLAAPGVLRRVIQPLPARASIQDVLAHSDNTLAGVETSWYDVRVRVFGPPGSIAPPVVYQAQVWTNRSTGETAGLAGVEGELPALVYTRSGLTLFAKPAAGMPWFRVLPDEEMDQEMFLVRRLMEQMARYTGKQACLQYQGEEKLEGASTLTYTCHEEAAHEDLRIWIDAISGQAVKQQYFLNGQLGIEIETAYEANFPYPRSLFDPWLPWRGGYARNAAGDPLPEPAPGTATPLPFTPAEALPAGFDARSEPLAVRYLDAPDWTRDSLNTGGQPAQLLAGDYLLRELNIAEPYSLVCRRSPTQEVVVFAEKVWEFDDHRPYYRNLRWINLFDPREVRTLETKAVITDFAFGPTGRYLAVLTHTEADTLSLLDLYSGQLQRLTFLNLPANPLWSQDGRYLAVSSSPDGAASSRYWWVFSIQSNRRMDFQAVDAQPGEPLSLATQIILQEWGIQAPAGSDEWQLCAP